MCVMLTGTIDLAACASAPLLVPVCLLHAGSQLQQYVVRQSDSAAAAADGMVCRQFYSLGPGADASLQVGGKYLPNPFPMHLLTGSSLYSNSQMLLGMHITCMPAHQHMSAVGLLHTLKSCRMHRRRSQVLQLLLAPCNTRTAVASAQELPSTTGVCSRCRHFMQCWRHALSSSDCWSTVVDVDLPVAVLHQQELLTACSPKELLELCLPEVLQQQQLDNLGPVDSGSSDLKSRNLRPKVVALLDAADDVSAAVVQLLQASMQCNAQVVSAPSLLSQQSQQQQHLLLEGCSHWLARQWVHEVFDRDRQDSSSRGFNTAAAAAGGAASVVQLAKRLLVAVTTCDRELKAVLSWLPA